MFSSSGQGIQQIKVLEHKAQLLPAEPGQLPGREGGDALPVQQDVPGADGVDGGDAVEQGGLPGARGPHDGNELPRHPLSKLTRSSALVTLFLRARSISRCSVLAASVISSFAVPYRILQRPAPLVSVFLWPSAYDFERFSRGGKSEGHHGSPFPPPRRPAARPPRQSASLPGQIQPHAGGAAPGWRPLLPVNPRSKIRGSSWAGMPRPLSATVRATRLPQCPGGQGDQQAGRCRYRAAFWSSCPSRKAHPLLVGVRRCPSTVLGPPPAPRFWISRVRWALDRLADQLRQGGSGGPPGPSPGSPPGRRRGPAPRGPSIWASSPSSRRRVSGPSSPRAEQAGGGGDGGLHLVDPGLHVLPIVPLGGLGGGDRRPPWTCPPGAGGRRGPAHSSP